MSKNVELLARRANSVAVGVAVENTGHCHPKIIEAARAQLEKFTHTNRP